VSVDRRRRWGDVVLRPHVLIALLVAGSAAAWLSGGFRDATVLRAPDLLTDVEVVAPPTSGDARIVVFDRDGLSRTVDVEVTSREAFEDRLAAALAVLRSTLIDDGAWPQQVGAPTVLAYEAQRRRVVVIDVPSLRGSGPDVLAELATLRSLEETAFAHGADEVRVVVDGAPAATLWGHVALR
jgi:hypothetical protein